MTTLTALAVDPGDLATWVGSIAAVISVVVLLITTLKERNRAQRAEGALHQAELRIDRALVVITQHLQTQQQLEEERAVERRRDAEQLKQEVQRRVNEAAGRSEQQQQELATPAEALEAWREKLGLKERLRMLNSSRTGRHREERTGRHREERTGRHRKEQSREEQAQRQEARAEWSDWSVSTNRSVERQSEPSIRKAEPGDLAAELDAILRGKALE